MHNGTAYCLMAAFTLASSARAQALVVPDVPVTTYSLTNGLRIVLQPTPSAPRVVGAVEYRVGEPDSPPGYEGLAHVVEHMTYRGSRHTKEYEGLAVFDRTGGSAHASTHADRTVYSASFDTSEIEKFLWIESERMGFTLEAMTEDALEAELEIVDLERLLRGSTLGYPYLDETVAHAAYPETHPYHRISERYDDAADFELKHVQWFFQTHYRPNNATLVLTGNFEPLNARRLIAKYFAPLRALPPLVSRAEAPAIEFGGQERHQIGVAQGPLEVCMVWMVPCTRQNFCTDLEVLVPLLGSGDDSPLVAGLVGTKLATNVALELVPRAQHMEVQLRVTLPEQGKTAPVVETIDAVLRQHAIPEAWSLALVEQGKLALATRFFESLEFSWSRAALLLQPDFALTAYLDRVLAATPASVARAVTEYMPLDRRLIVETVVVWRAGAKGELIHRGGNLNAKVVPLP